MLVVAPDTHEGQSVANEHRLYSLVKRRRATERRQNVHFKNPRLVVRVDQDVEAIELKAIHAVRWILLQVLSNVRLYAE